MVILGHLYLQLSGGSTHLLAVGLGSPFNHFPYIAPENQDGSVGPNFVYLFFGGIMLFRFRFKPRCEGNLKKGPPPAGPGIPFVVPVSLFGEY